MSKLSLVFDKILCTFIKSGLKDQIQREQNALMRHRRTVNQMLQYYKKLYDAYESKNDFMAVYFDENRQFNSDPHLPLPGE